MNFKTDIENRIKTDFGENSSEVFKILTAAVQKNDYLKTDRIIRCIVFLSERSIEKLKQSIETAILDPRDVLFWAEYTIRKELGTEKRVRDFNNNFDDADL
ncbi:hypothetical protein [Flavobacterium sp. LC2016-01]|uniref:hypothetical protein n=1 Tax=Flavobacterium sp. LC2016-01 TaxID=2675876 RepID=UPI0012BB14B1|nr:hypothetical protein [Flavobacterium sp. LC2016-01]MTH14139.1 hypothetical protein [Flavobacterium sp. LC2016-01]